MGSKKFTLQILSDLRDGEMKEVSVGETTDSAGTCWR